MRRLIVILAFALISQSASGAGVRVIHFFIPLSQLSNGLVVAFPFDRLPEGATQGGLSTIFGLPDKDIRWGNGSFTIPPETFLEYDNAFIHFYWSDAVGNVLLDLTYHICGTTTSCPRATSKFLIKTKAVVLGVRG